VSSFDRTVVNVICSIFTGQVTRVPLPVVVCVILAGSLCALQLAFNHIT